MSRLSCLQAAKAYKTFFVYRSKAQSTRYDLYWESETRTWDTVGGIYPLYMSSRTPSVYRKWIKPVCSMTVLLVFPTRLAWFVFLKSNMWPLITNHLFINICFENFFLNVSHQDWFGRCKQKIHVLVNWKNFPGYKSRYLLKNQWTKNLSNHNIDSFEISILFLNKRFYARNQNPGGLGTESHDK